MGSKILQIWGRFNLKFFSLLSRDFCLFSLIMPRTSRKVLADNRLNKYLLNKLTKFENVLIVLSRKTKQVSFSASLFNHSLAECTYFIKLSQPQFTLYSNFSCHSVSIFWECESTLKLGMQIVIFFLLFYKLYKHNSIHKVKYQNTGRNFGRRLLVEKSSDSCHMKYFKAASFIVLRGKKLKGLFKGRQTYMWTNFYHIQLN